MSEPQEAIAIELHEFQAFITTDPDMQGFSASDERAPAAIVWGDDLVTLGRIFGLPLERDNIVKVINHVKGPRHTTAENAEFQVERGLPEIIVCERVTAAERDGVLDICITWNDFSTNRVTYRGSYAVWWKD